MGRRLGRAVAALRHSTLSQIEDRLAPALDDPDLFLKPTAKDHCRHRIFPLARTFWCWIWQVLQAHTSCREVVRQMQVLLAIEGSKDIDEGTGAYCEARRKLPLKFLEAAFLCSGRSAERKASRSTLLQGRPLRAADGCGVRMADTPKNRKAFPPPKHQHSKPCFPVMKVVALFSLASGALLAKAIGTLRVHELRLFLMLRRVLQPRDILIADRIYGCYVLAASLWPGKVDLVARLSQRSRRIDFRKAKKNLGRNDALFVWLKPGKPSPLLTPAQWLELPAQITVRILRVTCQRPGFRTRQVVLVTTLLDAHLYPAQEIADAYVKRWRMELCWDDLKTTLGMEMLRCRSPELVEKELLVFMIAHNLLRWIMAQAAQQEGVDLERISFKGSMDAFRQWSIGLAQLSSSVRTGSKRTALWRSLLRTLAADLVPLRPGRHEPRAVKKPVKYPVLNKPRHLYVERWSRNKRRRMARAKKAALN